VVVEATGTVLVAPPTEVAVVLPCAVLVVLSWTVLVLLGDVVVVERLPSFGDWEQLAAIMATAAKTASKHAASHFLNTRDFRSRRLFFLSSKGLCVKGV
jgi:hypothetical protein